jgi:hypothetical protein
MITKLRELADIHIVTLCLGFLQADDIGRICRQPLQKSFFDGGSDAIDVVADQSHSVKLKHQGYL